MENEAQKQHLRLSAELRNRIVSGRCPAGKKMESVRKLAESFGSSPVTVLRALDILEQEGLIRRVPMKGVYVNAPSAAQMERPLNIVLPFPEMDFSEEKQGLDNYGMSFEFLQGMLSEVGSCNATLQMIYCESDKAKLPEQLQKLRNCDLAVFVGEQLLELQDELSRFCRVVRLAGRHGKVSGQVCIYDYDFLDAREQLVKLISGTGCKTAGMIGSWQNPQAARERSEVFLHFLEKYNIRHCCDLIWDNGTDISAIARMLIQNPLPEFFFCINAEEVAAIYEAARLVQLEVGKDFQMASIANGTGFSGLLPKYCYFKVPRFEMGKALIKHAADAIRNGQPLEPEKLPLFKVRLVKGNSTV